MDKYQQLNQIYNILDWLNQQLMSPTHIYTFKG